MQQNASGGFHATLYFHYFCLDKKETKNKEATSRSGKKRNCFVATIVVQSLLRHFQL